MQAYKAAKYQDQHKEKCSRKCLWKLPWYFYSSWNLLLSFFLH